MNLAPIVLFVYNRPWHTNQTLKYLKRNKLINHSTLYIYSDGAKNVSDCKENKNINKVREIIRNINWCKNVIIKEEKKNIGLAKTIINGVTEVINKHGSVIVLEDDIITSPYFLEYMNKNLNLYQDDERVYHVSAYIFPVKMRLPKLFFYNSATCWGWGTWKRSWDKLITNTDFILDQICQQNLIYKFNIENSYNFFGQLIDNKLGKIDTWNVYWYSTIFLNSGYCLHTYPSLTHNIGNDESGSNSKKTNQFNWNKLGNSFSIKKIEVSEDINARKHLAAFFSNSRAFSIRRLLLVLVDELKTIYRIYRYRKALSVYSFLHLNVKKSHRYSEVTIDFFRQKIKIPDTASFLFMYKEIFINNVYKFSCNHSQPKIIDCGANIGLSLIYFKKMYIDSEIIAFEADPKIYKILDYNIKAFNFSGITLINKALWDSETYVSFNSEGADAGMIMQLKSNNEIKTDVLSKYLNNEVDLLKIDIEGAEYNVLKESSSYLKNVKNIFIEYHSYLNSQQRLDEILQILTMNGFRYYVYTPGLTSKNPFQEIRLYQSMDMQVNIYAIRIEK